MKKTFTILLLTLGLTLSATQSVFYENNSNKIVKEISILGLKRTRKSVVLNKLDIEKGSILSEFNHEDFSQDILKTGILKEPVIEYLLVDDEVVIKIILTEKWSLVPAPIVSITSDDQTFGALLFESNFLGLNKQFYVDGSYSTKNGISGAGSFRDDIIPNKLGYYIMAGAGNIEDITLLDIDKEVVGSYSSQSIRDSIGLNYNFNRNYKLGFYIHHNYYDIKEKNQSSIDFSGISNFLETQVSFSIDMLKYTNTISSGLELYSYFSLGTNLEDYNIYEKFELSSSYTINPFNNLYFSTGGTLSLFDKPYLKQLYFGSSNYANTIPALSHDRHLAADIQVEYAILNFPWASFSLNALFEAGLYDRDGSDPKPYYGPAMGIRMYFPWLAVPAMGMNFGYNLESGIPNFSFSMGF